MGGVLSGIVTFFGVAALALLIAANVGTIKHFAYESEIYMLEVSLQDLNVDQLVPSSVASYTLDQLGLAEGYIFGMYGWCRASSGESGSSNVWSTLSYKDAECSSPSISYTFNLVTFLVDQINTYNSAGVTVSTSEITLPKDLSTYIDVSNAVSQLVYASSIAACGVQFLALLAEWLTQAFCGRFLGMLLQALAAVGALITSGAGTGLYLVYEKGINSDAGTYGFSARMSTAYLALTWVASVCSLIALAVSLLNCCCGGRERPQAYERVIA